MGNGKAGDNPPGYDGHGPIIPTPPRVQYTGEQLIGKIAEGGGVMPLFAEDAAREILSFANPQEVEELARLLETLYNEWPVRHAAERVRLVRELRNRFRARRESGGS
jgi:hypothetical protein